VLRALRPTDYARTRCVPTPIGPDVAACGACLGQLRDPMNRCFRYAFVNCPDCGQRFTIAEGLPHEGERAALRAFPTCEACEEEFADPTSHRYQLARCRERSDRNGNRGMWRDPGDLRGWSPAAVRARGGTSPEDLLRTRRALDGTTTAPHW